MAKAQVIKPVSKGLTWLTQMLELFGSKQITVPQGFKDQCLALEEVLKSDSSGLVNSLSDLAITSADVKFSIESSNANLSQTLNNWLYDVNSNLRGKIPTGINALAKEYYRERWKKSSLIVLRTIWEDVDGWKLPTKLWFVDGKNVVIEDDPKTKELGKEKYGLRVSKDKVVDLEDSEDEKLFVQKPFEDWGTDYPTPFLVKRGIFYNAKFMQLLLERGTNIVAKAIEYLMIMKKGDAELAKLNRAEFIYDKKELTEVKESLQSILQEMRVNGGSPIYSTNFDTDIEHLIPDYAKAINGDLYVPVEKRILSGFGMIDVFEGVNDTRKSGTLNPRGFIAEINSGVNDFSALLHDILMVVIAENKGTHKKLANSEMIQVRSSALTSLYNNDQKDYLRSLYDRGLLSKQTIVELTGDVDSFNEEVSRRKKEQTEGIDEKGYPSVMYPPIVQNQPQKEGGSPDKKAKEEKTSPDKKGPEKKNYRNR